MNKKYQENVVCRQASNDTDYKEIEPTNKKQYDEKETNFILSTFNKDTRKQTKHENDKEIMKEQEHLQVDNRN